jgi:bacterioferritin-associated ferredoxin
MSPVFIFAEQVRSIVRSGKKEIEIPAGARISSAAADLIKENHIQIKTVAPGAKSSDQSLEARGKPAAPPGKKDTTGKSPRPAEIKKSDSAPDPIAEISEQELEEVVNLVVERVKQLNGSAAEAATPSQTASGDATAVAAADGDDLVICRCEEITRGEIKAAIRNGMQTLNGVKRITRAGMGLCQGQTCQQLVARILTEELGLGAADIDPTTARGPVRPLRLAVFANS